MTADAFTDARQLWFTQPHAVAVRPVSLPPPGAGQVRVQTLCSAVSAGTEMLVYRGQVPGGMALDAAIAGMQDEVSYPLPYGYACVGEVTRVGAGVDPSWHGRRVFAFQPHASHFLSATDGLIPVPDDIAPEAAVFLANLETAVNLVQDGNPQLGERVVVLGQGIVGLLLSHLLAQFPLDGLYAVEGIPSRQAQALAAGVQAVCAPADAVAALAQQWGSAGADLVYEVSGAPPALDTAIALCGFTSRVVVGSWYGNKDCHLALGGAAHRNRLQIITSQVSTLAPGLTGRWDKARRFDLCWSLLRRLPVTALISHRVSLDEAGTLYAQLAQSPDTVMQALFVYPTD